MARSLPVARGQALAGLATLLGALAAGCTSGSGGDTTPIGVAGQLVQKPGGTLAFTDPNRGGGALRIRLTGTSWGRLVDVHDVDATTGKESTAPLFEDLVVDENTIGDGVNYRLETNPITLKSRLIVLRDYDEKPQEFEDLVRAAVSNLAPIQAKSDDGSSAPPFSFVARNSAIVLQFDDLLDTSPAALEKLPTTVKILTGYTPSQPFAARIIFDPNFGALSGSTFHSSRIIIDTTVSESELQGLPNAVPINALGLPASQVTSNQPNIAIRIPSREDPAGGQFEILRGLGGGALDRVGNGPQRFDLPTRDVVRAFRAGNGQDTNNGFLSDLNSPALIGGFSLTLDRAVNTPGGVVGFDFLVDITFTSTCQVRPEAGDVIEAGGAQLEVTTIASAPDGNGRVTTLPVRLLSEVPISNPNEFLGLATFLSTYDPAEPLLPACWVTFAPQPEIIPDTSVPPSAQILVRFSEPMDPASLRPFDTFQVLKGQSGVLADPTLYTVVGTVQSSSDLREHTFTPILPFHNGLEPDLVTPRDLRGTGAAYHILLGRVTDLGGRTLVNSLPPIDFTVDTSIPTQESLGMVLRFNSIDEFQASSPDLGLGAANRDDLRGQFFYDLGRGVIKPREVSRFAAVSDNSEVSPAPHPVTALFVPIPGGIQTPLSPLGSKLHAIYRYADMGWLITDESKYNLQVEGISWSPVGGQVIADFYERFEMRLSHCSRLPDEYFDSNLLPSNSASGLARPNQGYNANILGGATAQQVVHNRDLGYELNPIDVFFTGLGVAMMPYPWNRSGGPKTVYTWRDTSNQALGALTGAGPGLPMEVECKAPLNLYGSFPSGGEFHSSANGGGVPTIGLPLLMEFRCFPSSTGLGLNSLAISIARNNSAVPTFRAFSTGGINASMTPVVKDPDLQPNPTGGFNPNSTPPGGPTLRPDDNVVYVGQLDCVVKVSQVHTMFMDSVSDSGLVPDYLQPVVEPRPEDQPLGTQVIVDFRSAFDFNARAKNQAAPFDAQKINAYGNFSEGNGTAFFHPRRNDAGYLPGIDAVDGGRFLQLRFTFVNNVDTGQNAELSAIGVPYLAKTP